MRRKWRQPTSRSSLKSRWWVSSLDRLHLQVAAWATPARSSAADRARLRTKSRPWTQRASRYAQPLRTWAKRLRADFKTYRKHGKNLRNYQKLCGSRREGEGESCLHRAERNQSAPTLDIERE